MMDLHCHLDLYPDPVSVVDEVVHTRTFVLSVTTTPTAFDRTSALNSNDAFIATGVGLHPQLVHERAREAHQIADWIHCTDFVGEIGLDGGSEYGASWGAQMEIFEYALQLSDKNGGRILSIHSRRAAKPVLKLLEQNCSTKSTPILHWFSGSRTELKWANDIGCWYSVGPAMLAGKKGKELLQLIPRDRLLLETDGPFTTLKGVPYMPWDAEKYCVPIVASEWSMSEDAVKSILNDNLMALLSKRHVTSISRK